MTTLFLSDYQIERLNRGWSVKSGGHLITFDEHSTLQNHLRGNGENETLPTP